MRLKRETKLEDEITTNLDVWAATAGGEAA